MRYDERGVPVSAARPESLQHYETALRQFQSYVGDPVATLDAALAQDPDFVTGHLMKALVLYTLGERKYAPAGESSLGAAVERSAHANERELILMQAVRQLLAGQWHAACRTLDGVLVDEWLRSVTDPRISAVGDCARHPHPRADGLVRLESVQNATDQGTAVGRRIAGAPPVPYRSLPWFWSDQGAVKLQIAGLRTDTDEVRVVPGDAADRLAAYAFRDDRLVAVETLNWPAEHLAARRLLDRPAPVRAADLEGSTLGSLARAGRTAEART